MAKRFSFRLDGLHRFRQHKTNEAKLALGEITRLRQNKQKEIEEMLEYLKHLDSSRRTTRVLEYQVNVAHAESVRQHIVKLHEELQSLSEIELLRRTELTHTMRDEKVLDKLREKKLSEYHHSVLIEEQTQMDEIAMRSDSSVDA